MRILVLRDEKVQFVPSLIDFPKRSSFGKQERCIFPRILHWTRAAIGSKIKKACAAADRTTMRAAGIESRHGAADRTAMRTAGIESRHGAAKSVRRLRERRADK